MVGMNTTVCLTVHIELFDQEGLAAVFGNGLSTACVVNIGAQVTSIICIEVNETSVSFNFYHHLHLL